MAKKRLIELDLAKGFAIFLVVLGHIISGGAPSGNEWFRELHMAIYRFHMPLFMALSGMIFYYTTKPFENPNDFLIYVKKKASRLMPGFFIFGLIILVGKSLMSNVMQVANTPTSYFSEIINILFYPYDSSAGSLWYIYVLFEFYLFTPIVLKIFRNNVFLNVFFAAALHFIFINFQITHLFMINMFFQYYFYFSIGFVLLTYYDTVIPLFEKYGLIFYVLFGLSFITRSYLAGPYNKTIISLFSIPAIISFSNTHLIKKFFNSSLMVLSEYTFTIYLLNTITMGFAKGIMFKFFSWNGINFLIYLPVLLFAGIVIPIYIYKYILSKNKFLSKITK